MFDLQEKSSRQLTLMESAVSPADEWQARLMKVLNGINDKFGRGTLRSLSQGPEKAFWQMRRNILSGAFTTKWTELPEVKA